MLAVSGYQTLESVFLVKSRCELVSPQRMIATRDDCSRQSKNLFFVFLVGEENE